MVFLFVFLSSLILQGCALVPPYFALKRLGNRSFFIEILRMAPWFKRFRTRGSLQLFLENSFFYIDIYKQP